MRDLDLHRARKNIETFIRSYIIGNGFKKGLIGVSGGVDSALTLALTVNAIGAENTHALLMPYKISSKDSLTDGRVLCEQFSVSHDIIDITPALDAYFDCYPADNSLQIGNKCARERMSVLYDFSVRQSALVVGTSNKSEILIGYATQFGDAAAAFIPIGELYKTEVYRMAEMLGLPKSILEKAPSADLWIGQTDEDEIGLPYDELDEILYQLVDLKTARNVLESRGINPDKIDRVSALIKQSEFKRHMPPAAPLKG